MLLHVQAAAAQQAHQRWDGTCFSNSDKGGIVHCQVPQGPCRTLLHAQAAGAQQAHEWSFRHFPDPEHGEWYGWLHRDGTPSTRMKGSLWKGPFHLPRMQWYCWRLLNESAG
jgi:hypothetical protein